MNSSFSKCVFCLKDFNLIGNLPYILHDCGHSICQICLAYQLNRYNSFDCPEDGRTTSLQDKTTDNFPKNIALMNFLSQQKDEEKRDRVFTENKDKTKSLRMTRNMSESKIRMRGRLAKQARSIHQRLESEQEIKEKEKNNSENNFGVITDSYSDENLEDVCGVHGKKLEVICMQEGCEKKICYQCGLFGEHKVD